MSDGADVYGMFVNLESAVEMMAEKLERGCGRQVKEIVFGDAEASSDERRSIEERLTTLNEIVFRLVEEMVEVVESMRPGDGNALRRRLVIGS